jgi:hypothetical protein
VPTDLLAERAADQRRQERADIDADIEDGEGTVAPRIAGRVERSRGICRTGRPEISGEG